MCNRAQQARVGQERLAALSMLSIEKDFIFNITEFNKKVIDRFANIKDRHLDFNFK